MLTEIRKTFGEVPDVVLNIGQPNQEALPRIRILVKYRNLWQSL
jgi:hypothetical protein